MHWFQIIINSTRSPLTKQLINRYVNGMEMRLFGTYRGENEQPVSWTGASCVNSDCYYEEHEDNSYGHHLAIGDHPVKDHSFEHVSIPFCLTCGLKYMRGMSVSPDISYMHALMYPNDLQLNELKLNGGGSGSYYDDNGQKLPYVELWKYDVLDMYSDDLTGNRNALILFAFHEMFGRVRIKSYDPDQEFAKKVQLEALHVNCVRDMIHPIFSLTRREFAEFKAASVL